MLPVLLLSLARLLPGNKAVKLIDTPICFYNCSRVTIRATICGDGGWGGLGGVGGVNDFIYVGSYVWKIGRASCRERV